MYCNHFLDIDTVEKSERSRWWQGSNTSIHFINSTSGVFVILSPQNHMLSVASLEIRVHFERSNKVVLILQARLRRIFCYCCLQKEYYKCGYECFNRSKGEIPRCIERCSAPVERAGAILQNEMNRFQVSAFSLPLAECTFSIFRNWLFVCVKLFHTIIVCNNCFQMALVKSTLSLQIGFSCRHVDS